MNLHLCQPLATSLQHNFLKFHPMVSSLSSSFSFIPQHKDKYDVFLSFCGEDTRYNFTSQLYSALCNEQIRTFTNEDKLERGVDISSPCLLKAIEGSKIAVVIFSENYVFSKWCLYELLEILNCSKRNRQTVVPVFYNVSPSDLKKKVPSIGDAFVRKGEENIQSYRDAVTEACKISGFSLTTIRPEAKLVEAVVSDIRQKLNKISLSTDHKGLVGLKPYVDAIISLLDIKLSDIIRVVGIWGVGGIGKTTLAKAVYQDISGQYEGCCFVANINKKIQKGIARLKQGIVSKILKEEKLHFDTKNGIYLSYKNRLKDKKVLVVLDDVDTSEMIRTFIPIIHLCGSGSRAIIITRNKEVLEDYGVVENYIYEVKGLRNGGDLQLFLTSAFKQDAPPEYFMSLSKQIIPYAEGHPLCLKTLGSSLRGEKPKVWECALNALKAQDSQTLDIYKVLNICYDILDEKEKIVFIDFPYEFEGHKKESLIRRLESLYGSSGLIALMHKTIVTESSGKLHMHRLLGETAVKIFTQELSKKPDKFHTEKNTQTDSITGISRRVNYRDSFMKPNKCSRFELHEDSPVFQNNDGTDSIKCTFQNMSSLGELRFGSVPFAKMSDLRLLKICNNEELYTQFNHLRYLSWHTNSSKPKDQLVDFKLSNSTFGQPPKRSRNLSSIPSLSTIPSHVDAVSLGYYGSPRSSPQILKNLKKLDLSDTAIEEIPTSICKLKSLSRLILGNCFKLKRFPEILETMERLEYLWLSGAKAIKEIPSSIEHLIGLVELALVCCISLVTLPNSICKLRSLSKFNLYGCSKLERLPENLGDLICLEELDASRTALGELPSSITALWSLKVLLLDFCNLREIPKDLYHMPSLKVISMKKLFPQSSLHESYETVTDYCLPYVSNSIRSKKPMWGSLRKWMPRIKNLGRHHDHADISGKSTGEKVEEFVELSYDELL